MTAWPSRRRRRSPERDPCDLRRRNEASAGFGLSFPWDTTCAFLYRHVWRFYEESITGEDGDKRFDRIHFLSLDISRELTEHWSVSIAGSATLNESNEPFFDYDRFVIGGYTSYHF